MGEPQLLPHDEREVVFRADFEHIEPLLNAAIRRVPALGDAGFTTVEPWFDEDGDLRGIVARRV